MNDFEAKAKKVIETMTEDQKEVMYGLIGNALNSVMFKQVSIKDAPNGRYYIELPDGYRLIYDNNGYVGRYNPSMEEPI